MKDRICMTKPDFEQLHQLVEGRHAGYSYDRPYLDALERELDREEIVVSYTVAPDVVTMNSEVRLKDLDTGKVSVHRLVFPSQARSENSISVLTPNGTALLGYRIGDVVQWQVPKGIRRVQVLEVFDQPGTAELAVLSSGIECALR